MAIRDVPLDLIDDNPYNPRKYYAPVKIKEMADSLHKVGMRQGVEGRQVDGRVQLAYGHMRLRAYRHNLKQQLPGSWATMPVDVKELSDREMFDFALEENLRRTDIKPIEVARCVQGFNTVFPEITEKQIGEKHGMTEANVSNMLRVLRLPEKFLEKIDEGVISFTQGRELLTLEGIPDAEELMSSALAGINTTGNKQYSKPNTVEGLRQSIHSVINNKFPPLDKEWGGYRYNLLFDTREAGCLKCDKCIITHPTKSQAAHHCTDDVCWEKKQEDHKQKAAAVAKAKMEAEVRERAAKDIAKRTPEPEPAAEKPAPVPQAPEYTTEKRGISWIALDNRGLVIAIGTTKKEADDRAVESFKPVATVIDPKPSEYVLNHTYRISRKWELRKPDDIYDVTAQDLATAVKSLGVKVEDIEAVRVFKSSGKLGTGGDVSAGWSKCTEPLGDFSQEKLELPAKRKPVPVVTNTAGVAIHVPCDSCAKADLCDRSHFHVAADGSGQLVCEEKVEQVATPKKVKTIAPAPSIPEDILTLAKEKAGTRAEVLDLNDICTGERHWRQIKSGYALLSDEIRYVDEPEECLERCTHGFHYAFDSKYPGDKEIYVCSDTKCLAKKKGALTRKRNAAGQARKNAEKEAIKQVLDQVGEVAELVAGHAQGITAVAGIKAPVVAVTRPVLRLIIYNHLHGSQISKYFYGDRGKEPTKWLWDKLSAGTTAEKRNEGALWKLIDKLSDADMVKIIIEMMFFYLSDTGDVASYEIKTREPLKWFGIEINTNEEEAANDQQEEAMGTR